MVLQRTAINRQDQTLESNSKKTAANGTEMIQLQQLFCFSNSILGIFSIFVEKM